MRMPLVPIANPTLLVRRRRIEAVVWIPALVNIKIPRSNLVPVSVNLYEVEIHIVATLRTWRNWHKFIQIPIVTPHSIRGVICNLPIERPRTIFASCQINSVHRIIRRIHVKVHTTRKLLRIFPHPPPHHRVVIPRPEPHEPRIRVVQSAREAEGDDGGVAREDDRFAERRVLRFEQDVEWSPRPASVRRMPSGPRVRTTK